ncbi:GrpB family protein [Ramlibacter sp. G-1-2-2]|uniref:GrpB family protein n=1 Tax=Ramlibacter agri TaxID=2728837 RepID=A0A848HEN3_9BURK|nr:GrpB family protein [Ramlibacter agri]NML48642.1 GrpB family protein [Ramlibacter agri]
MKLAITIVPPQRSWAGEFAGAARKLRDALGGLALRIDHIGSTSVPGLAAKDIIDVQLTVGALEPQLDEALVRAGYERLPHITQDHVPPGATEDPRQWAKWFYKPRQGRPVNLHVRVAGCANQRYALLFRDYLRANAAAAAAYQQVKLALVEHHADDVDAYYAIKDPVCDVIMAAAEAWAAHTGWAAGPTDQ